MNKPKLIISSAYAAIITIVFVTVITIWAELFAPLKDWLKNFSGHHWTSKSILSALLFTGMTIVLYFLPHKSDGARITKTLWFLLACTFLGIIFLAAFFTGHHFKVF